MKRIFFLLVFLLLCSCGTSEVVFQTDSEKVIIQVELAQSPQEQAVGLMFRTYMNANKGMLFTFTTLEKRGFWMKNTKIPLDIIFLDADKSIVDIKENFQSCTADPCEVYYSKPAQYVLEVNAGFVHEHDLHIGDVATFK